MFKSKTTSALTAEEIVRERDAQEAQRELLREQTEQRVRQQKIADDAQKRQRLLDQIEVDIPQALSRAKRSGYRNAILMNVLSSKRSTPSQVLYEPKELATWLLYGSVWLVSDGRLAIAELPTHLKLYNPEDDVIHTLLGVPLSSNELLDEWVQTYFSERTNWELAEILRGLHRVR